MGNYQELLSHEARVFLKKTEKPQPQYYCSSCLKLKDGSFCSCFQRRVEADYNRCYNHSNYDPIVTPFRVPANIDEIVRENEEKRYA